jgi:hypothetical protein
MKALRLRFGGYGFCPSGYTLHVGKFIGILPAIVFHLATPFVGAQYPPALASLIPEADVIVVVEISNTDYSRTPSDGPMTARAKVLSSLKGGMRKDQSFGFTETAWVGPSYKTGDVRVLFMESAGNEMRIVGNLYAKTDFFVERDAIPLLNLNSLKSALERLPVPTPRRAVITRDLLK